MSNNQKFYLIIGIIILMSVIQYTTHNIPPYLINIFTALITAIIGININPDNNKE